KTLRLWDLVTGRTKHILAGHTGPVRALAIMPDGQRAISASADQTLRIWDLESGQVLHTLVGHKGEVGIVHITPDGKRAVSGSQDGTLRVWDLNRGEALHTLRHPANDQTDDGGLLGNDQQPVFADDNV